MRNKVFISIFSILLSVILGIIIYEVKQEYVDSSLYLERIYQKNPTTLNLVKLCDNYSDNNDMKYLQYIDELLIAEDYNQVVGQYYEISDNVNVFKNVQIMTTMYICAANDDIDGFINAMEKYYVQLESGNKPYYFYKVMVELDTSFVNDNKDKIVSKLYDLCQVQDAPLLRLRELMNILAYYNVVDTDNEQSRVVKSEMDSICNELNYENDITERLSEMVEDYESYWLELLV